MSKTWQLQEAKAKFSAVVEAAQKDGPQFVTRHGLPTAVVISQEEYERLKPKKSLVEFFQSAPYIDDLSIFERSKDMGRDIEL